MPNKINELFDKYDDKKQNLGYVSEQIKAGNYTFLPDEIANGIVLKIQYEGNLEKDGYEIGFLVLNQNAEIKEHIHTNDIEKYTILKGNLSVNNKEVNENICLINQKHNIDKVKEITVIKTLKINKESLIPSIAKLKQKQKKFCLINYFVL